MWNWKQCNLQKTGNYGGMNMKSIKKVLISVLLIAFGMNMIQIECMAQGDTQKNDIVFDSSKVFSLQPITELEWNGELIEFKYNENNQLIEKCHNGKETYYYYEKNSNLSMIRNNEGEILFHYEDYCGEPRCTEMVYKGDVFRLIYDVNNNVIEIQDSAGNIVCNYRYEDGNPIPILIEHSKNDKDNMLPSVGEVNPFRYQGWLLDTETNYYYLGEGIFYNPIDEMFIQNDYELTDYGKEWLNMATETRTLNYNQINNIINVYNAAISSAGYGATSYSQVTQSQWNAGQRWYDGISELEVIARCIWAESSYPNKSNDRTGIAATIMNRRMHHNASGINIVTQANQYYTINPPYISIDETKGARSAKAKTDEAWKQATLLACVIIYANETSDIGYFNSIPIGITTQRSFRGLNNSISLNYNNGNIIIAGEVRTNIAIAGYGTIVTQAQYNYLEGLRGQGYTVFFNE